MGAQCYDTPATDSLGSCTMDSPLGRYVTVWAVAVVVSFGLWLSDHVPKLSVYPAGIMSAGRTQ